MSRIRRIAPGLGRGGLLGNTEGPEAYLRELDTLPSQFCRATGGTETVISQGGKFYRVHTFTDTDPTSLLLNFDGANGSTTFTDDSGWGHAVTANGDAEISTTQSKFGGSSGYFDGNGDYISANHPAFALGTSAATVEMWVRFSSLPSAGGAAGFCNTQASISSADNTAWYFVLVNESGTYKLKFGRHGDENVKADATWSPSTGTWYHIAAVRQSSGFILLFVDGSSLSVSQTSEAGWQSNNFTQTNFSAGGVATPVYLHGYIDSLRITKGQALYTSAFTPPTTALTRVGSGSLTFTRGGSVEYLVVGGGGGGGSFRAGGGGGGGYRSSVVGESSGGGASAEPKKTVAATSYAVTVGAGGAGGPYTSDATGTSGASGQTSSFDDITSLGGGAGGTDSTNGISGGSGGGAGGSLGSSTGGNGTTSQGYAGGDNGQYGAGGGGGAGAAGASGVVDDAGNGGDGVQSSIDGTATYRSGGGGGGTYLGGTSPSVGSGGLGGGTAGGNIGASNAAANTGGGGGGGSQGGGQDFLLGGPGGDGGSGIVIARYRITQAEYEAEAA